MLTRFDNYAKESADTIRAQTLASKEQYEFGQEVKADKQKESYERGLQEILSSQPKAEEPPQEKKVGGWEPPETTRIKDLMDKNKAEQQAIAQSKQQLNALMLNAAKNGQAAKALEYRKELDGFDTKQMEKSTESLTLQGKQLEREAEMARGFLANPTDESWYQTVAQALKDGMPQAEKLFQVPRDKREAVAKEFLNRATTTKDALTAQRYANALEAKSSVEKNKQDYREWRMKRTDRKDIADREKTKWDQTHKIDKQNYSEAKDHMKNLEDDVKDSSREFEKANSDYQRLLNARTSLEKDMSGNTDPEVRARELAEINSEIEDAKDRIAVSETDKKNAEQAKQSFAKKLGAKDTHTPIPTPTPKIDIRENAISKDLITRFSADPNTKNMTLGKHTPDGWEVLDVKGKVVGHFE